MSVQSLADASRAAAILVAVSLRLSLVPGPAEGQEKFLAHPIDVHDIEAVSVDQTFRVQVAMPMSRASSDDRYPVLYVTDVNGSMDAMVGIVELLTISGEMPSTIVVGIGYPVQSLMQTLVVRARDLTPVPDPQLAGQEALAAMIEGALTPSTGSSGGGADDFLQFIHEELIPFIDSNYPTTDDRGYFGDSLGGLFGLYTLFERPETFQGYIIGSPSAWVGGEWIMTRAEEFVAGHGDLAARVFMAVGGNEEIGPELAPARMVTNVGRLETLLVGADFPSLRLQTHIFPDESHASVAYMNLIRGLHTVYDPSSNALLDAIVESMGAPGGGGR